MHSGFFTLHTQVDTSCNCAIMSYVTFEVDTVDGICCECILVLGLVCDHSHHGVGCILGHGQEQSIHAQQTQAISIQNSQTHSAKTTQIQASQTP